MLAPDRSVELEVLSKLAPGQYVAGIDEVGRGALAGPVSVGIALVSHDSPAFPVGLCDSKLLSPAARERLVAPVLEWVAGAAVGNASAEQVNEFGIIGALRLAAADALAQLSQFDIGAVILDGSHDWFTSNELFGPQLPPYPVRMEVKGDARCAVVAAASVLAKVDRDAQLVALHEEFPHYDWASNKGYASARHTAALGQLGASKYHRTAWKLPGIK